MFAGRHSGRRAFPEVRGMADSGREPVDIFHVHDFRRSKYIYTSPCSWGISPREWVTAIFGGNLTGVNESTSTNPLPISFVPLSTMNALANGGIDFPTFLWKVHFCLMHLSVSKGETVHKARQQGNVFNLNQCGVPKHALYPTRLMTRYGIQNTESCLLDA